MDHRVSLSFLVIALAALPGPCAGQAVKKTAASKTAIKSKKPVVARTPWGDPDLQGVFRTDSPPYLPTIYNNDFQIFQSPGFVVIAPEMIHSARVIPLDGRPHIGKNLKQWLGDSRGKWEGDTLVVETTNFRTDDGVVFQGANPDTFKITERF